MPTGKLAQTYSTEEAAKELEVTSRTIVNWCKDGTLKGCYKQNPKALNSPLRVPVKAVEDLKRERRQS